MLEQSVSILSPASRYRAFDELNGIEVAWNQVKICDVSQSAREIERLYSELHLLKTLKHKSIIKFYNSWVDMSSMNINFITEFFTSGTLRRYRQKHKHVNLKAVKNWSRQILRGLVFLHSRDPPVIHRDLKCDNIFINGNSGEVKIGDLGLATIFHQNSANLSILGTPEFMAPELYEEDYNELVDVYAFGMCLLEMITSEYPYSECRNAAQIYKKVITGKRPAALGKITDPEIRGFVEKCLASASYRPQARELLMDPFLCDDEDVEVHKAVYSRQKSHLDLKSISETDYLRGWESGSMSPKDRTRSSADFRINGRNQSDKKVLVRIQIANIGGEAGIIQFDFDLEVDTAVSVASEMVAELGLTDQVVTIIANMIDAQIMALVPNWNPGSVFEEREDIDFGKMQNGDVNFPYICDEKGNHLHIGASEKKVECSDDSLLITSMLYSSFEEIC